MKKVILVHGWDGHPENAWFPWLRDELKKKGFEVIIPIMPNSDRPKIEEWVGFLRDRIPNPDEETYFVGHSIGCQAIMRYLQEFSENIKVGGVILVAGWISLTPISTRTKKEKEIVKPWFETPLHFDKIKEKTKKFIAIFSDNDSFVPLKENSNTYKTKLDAKIIVEKGKGHFSDDDNVKQLPIVLKEILEMTR